MGAIPTRVLTGLALLTLTTLTACTGNTGTADPPPATPTTTTTTTPTPTPTQPVAPVMPQAAKAHTKAGAKAFVRYFWQVVNYAQATGDTAAVADLADSKSCSQCNAGIKGIDDVYSR